MKVLVKATLLLTLVGLGALLGPVGCATRVIPDQAYITKHGQYRYPGSQQQVFEAAKRALLLEGYQIAMADTGGYVIVTRPKLIQVSVHATQAYRATSSSFSVRLTVRVIDGASKVTVRITPTAFVGGVRDSEFAFKDRWLRYLLNTILRSIWDENAKNRRG